MLHEKGGHYHPHTIVHCAGLPELTHPSVNDRIPRSPTLPRMKKIAIHFPGEGAKFRTQRTFAQVRHIKQQMTTELTPTYLGEQLFHVACKPWAFGRCKTGTVPDLPRSNLTKAQVR